MSQLHDENQLTTSIIVHSAPFSTIAGKEGVDLALVCAAFEQKVNLIFVGSGVLHLSRNQNADAIDDKLHDKQLGALEFYDIEQVYCETSSLAAFGLDENEIIDNCKVIDKKTISEMLNNSCNTVTF